MNGRSQELPARGAGERFSLGCPTCGEHEEREPIRGSKGTVPSGNQERSPRGARGIPCEAKRGLTPMPKGVAKKFAPCGGDADPKYFLD